MGQNNLSGAWGEAQAAAYLRKKKYSVVAAGFRCRYGEIDIIAKDDECTVFVEVKTRKNNLFGEPSEYVNYHKQQRLVRAANCFIDTVNSSMRFDVIEVFYQLNNGIPNVTKINHIENAF